VSPFVDAPEGFFDRLQDLCIGLLQLQLDVDLVVAAGLIRHVALAGIVLHRRLEGLDTTGSEDVTALSEQRFLVVLRVHRVVKLLHSRRPNRAWRIYDLSTSPGSSRPPAAQKMSSDGLGMRGLARRGRGVWSLRSGVAAGHSARNVA